MLGEVAYDLRWLIPPRAFFTGLIVAISCGTIVAFVVLTRRASLLVALLFLLSPAGLLFPIYDQHAFARKDVFILGGFAWAAWVCTRSQGRSALPALVLGWFALGFVVETAWLYLPVSVALYCWTRGREAPMRWHVIVWSSVASGLALCFSISIAANHDVGALAAALEQKRAIIASWDRISPGTTFDPGALAWLGKSISDGVRMALAAKGERSMALGYAIALILALVPAALCILQSRASSVGMRIWLPALGAFAIMSLTFLLGGDWGRYIHLWTVQAFVFALVVRPRIEMPAANRSDRATVAVATALVVIYASTWRLKHYVWPGGSALVPGAVFRLVRTTPT